MNTSKSAQNNQRTRATVSPESVTSYFDYLEQSINGIPPKNIVNYDETNLLNNSG